MLVGDVLGRNANVEAQIESGVDFERHFFAFQLVHRLLQQPDVHVEADRADVPVLFAAQNVAGAAQLQIERRDLEPRAQVAEFLQRGQPLARDLAQLRVGGNQQIRIRAPIRPAHAAAQLVQLRQARSARHSR